MINREGGDFCYLTWLEVDIMAMSFPVFYEDEITPGPFLLVHTDILVLLEIWLKIFQNSRDPRRSHRGLFVYRSISHFLELSYSGQFWMQQASNYTILCDRYCSSSSYNALWLQQIQVWTKAGCSVFTEIYLVYKSLHSRQDPFQDGGSSGDSMFENGWEMSFRHIRYEVVPVVYRKKALSGIAH